MVNLTVITKKDIKKYLVRLVIICVLLLIITKYFFSSKKENVQIEGFNLNLSNYLGNINLKECLEGTIPGIKEYKKLANDEEDIYESDIKSIEPLKVAMDIQTKMFTSLALKNSEDNTANLQGETLAQDNNQQGNETSESAEKVEQAQVGLSTEVVPNNVPDKYTNQYHGVQIKNSTEYNLTEEMLTPDVTVNNSNVIIFHTHTCESYTSSPGFEYTPTGNYRTTDLNFNVVRVGTELEKQLKSYKYNVIHDVTYHDYPAYNGSYDRSLTTVSNLLAQNPNTDVVFDIHRDAIGDYSYAPKVKIGDEYAAQLMFVIGTDGGGLEHPNWLQNLKFAVKIQEKANELYPGLFKSIVLRNTRYNQHLAKGASIIEVGSTGNTMDECLNSMKYLAKVLSEVLN